MAPADQTTDPDSGVGADADALVRGLGVAIGDRLDGRYRLDSVLHTTGPAVTWLATDEKLNRPTRIHLLRSDEPRAEAFMAAARAAAAMPDNHFVQVLDAVPDEGLYYVITEWLHDGHTLGEVLSRGPVPVPEAIRIGIELARAMAEAHDNGLAHLRLSPKTVLRTDTGEVKILDLCLAAALTGTVSRDPLGTDLTAIGELVYAMLTGKRPQPEPIPPSQLRPEVTPQLDEVVLRILGDPSAGEPYQTPVEVAEALAQLPRPRYEAPALPSTPQTAPLRHAQTTVMPASIGQTSPMAPAPAARTQPYPPAPNRPPAAAQPAGPGGRRPVYDDADYGRSRRGGSSATGGGGANLKLIGGVAAVAAVALVAYFAFSGNDKGSGSAGATGTSAPPATAKQTTSAAAGPLTPAAVSVYDADDGTEGQDGAKSVLSGGHGWSTLSYCQNYGTADRQKKPGTGLVFDLGGPHQISDVQVQIGNPGATMEMWVGDQSVTAAPPVVLRSPPANFTKVAEGVASGNSVDLKPTAAASGRFVLVWFTLLGQEPTANPKIPCKTTYADSIVSVKFTGS